MRVKLGFGVGAAAEAAIGIAFNTWNFLFYNNVLGLSGTLCGLAVTIALILDAVSDPVIGSLSDRLRSRLGRRHPFLFAAALPLALAFFLLYCPPVGLSGIPLFLWFTFFGMIQRQAMTLYSVPHLALGAELSDDYRERSVVMSYNSIFAMLGGVSTFFFGWTWFGDGGTAVRANYPGMGALVGGLAAFVIFLSAWSTRDQIPRLKQPALDLPRFSVKQLASEIRDCLSNPNYRVLLVGLVLMSATLGTRETLSTYVSLFFWELPESKIRVFGLASPPAFILAFVLTVRFHDRFDKRATIIGGLIATFIASVMPISLRLLGLMPANGAPGLVSVLMFFVFLFYTGVAVLMISVLSALADIADEHELNTGRRQEGVFFASRTFFGKLTSAFGHLIAGVVIDLIGFPSGAKPGEVAHDVVVKLGLFEGPIASLPALAAAIWYARYRIDRARHTEIRAQLTARAAAAAASVAVAPAE
jgi:Na+/melibiose symporter-like transporter